MIKKALGAIAIPFFCAAFFLLEWSDNGFKSACRELFLFFQERLVE